MRDSLFSDRFAEDLKSWLLQSAFPIWWQRGADHEYGGFVEELTLNGKTTEAPRRGRIQPRQIYSFACAARLGWDGPADEAVQHGLDFLDRAQLTDSGTYVTLVDRFGSQLDDTTLLYDQAFALLAFGTVAATLPDRAAAMAAKARNLFSTLSSDFSHPERGFFETPGRNGPLLANSHMHLFEAALALRSVDPEGPWSDLCDSLATLAADMFSAGTSDRIFERFQDNWTLIPGKEGQRIEPGHQFEWAYLLVSWSENSSNDRLRRLAVNLFETGESRGVDTVRQAAFAEIFDDWSIADMTSRLWPQTERVRTALAMTELAKCGYECPRSEEEYRSIAGRAAKTLGSYLLGPDDPRGTAGLWMDKLMPDGRFVTDKAPASSLYHIVSLASYACQRPAEV